MDEDPRRYTIKVSEEMTTSAGDSDLQVINDDEIKRNGIIDYTVIRSHSDNPFDRPPKVKVTGLKCGTQKIQYTYGGYIEKRSYLTITVDEVAVGACPPDSPEYNYFRNVFNFLRRPDLWTNFEQEVNANPRGILDWSRVWREPGMDYIQSLQRVSRMLQDAHHRGFYIDHYQHRAREIRENRERVMQRYRAPDPGHINVRNNWFYCEIAMELVVVFGSLIITAGLDTPEVVAWLAARGLSAADVLPYLIIPPK